MLAMDTYLAYRKWLKQSPRHGLMLDPLTHSPTVANFLAWCETWTLEYIIALCTREERVTNRFDLSKLRAKKMWASPTCICSISFVVREQLFWFILQYLHTLFKLQRSVLPRFYPLNINRPAQMDRLSLLEWTFPWACLSHAFRLASQDRPD